MGRVRTSSRKGAGKCPGTHHVGLKVFLLLELEESVLLRLANGVERVRHLAILFLRGKRGKFRFYFSFSLRLPGGVERAEMLRRLGYVYETNVSWRCA